MVNVLNIVCAASAVIIVMVSAAPIKHKDYLTPIASPEHHLRFYLGVLPTKELIDGSFLAKPYKCDICGKTFTTSRYLTKHKKIHTDQKSHECDICEKAFSTSGYLYQHKQIHTDEKPHECDICGKNFSTSANLNKHKKIHGDKLHECDICRKTFTHGHQLKRHGKTHKRRGNTQTTCGP